jgi:hypothetical protein
MPTITTRQLHDLLKPVLAFASKDETLPILCSVHIKATDEGLTSEATDRYKLGHQTVKGIENDGFEALIHVNAARKMLSTFTLKAPLKGLGEVTLWAHRDDDGQQTGKVIVSGDTGDQYVPFAEFAIETVKGDYPKLAALWEKNACKPDVAFNPNYLSDITASVPDPHGPILIHLNGMKPAYFEQEMDGHCTFKALLMPRDIRPTRKDI